MGSKISSLINSSSKVKDDKTASEWVQKFIDALPAPNPMIITEQEQQELSKFADPQLREGFLYVSKHCQSDECAFKIVSALMLATRQPEVCEVLGDSLDMVDLLVRIAPPCVARRNQCVWWLYCCTNFSNCLKPLVHIRRRGREFLQVYEMMKEADKTLHGAVMKNEIANFEAIVEDYWLFRRNVLWISRCGCSKSAALLRNEYAPRVLVLRFSL